MYAKILGMGSYLPKNIVTNRDLEEKLDTSDEWIVQRTGIKQRHIISGDESNLSMAVSAAKDAIKNSNLNSNDIDMIIVATCTNDKTLPALACYVQRELSIPTSCAAFDVAAACSGFIYALSIANQFIKSGLHKNILVVASETMSRVTDWEDRASCILFGDGAAACVVGVSDTPGIIGCHLHALGKHADLLYANQNDYIKMAGKEVFKHAVNSLKEIVQETIVAQGFKNSDIDWLIPHQANYRIIEAMARKLDMAMDNVVITVDKHANTSAASIPLAMHTAIADGRVKRGDLLLLEAFGAGLTWGSALIKY